MWTKLALEWDGARFHAQALASEAVYNPKLSALPAVLRIKIVSGPEIFSLDIQAWIGDTEAPVFKLSGMLDETDNRHFSRLVTTLHNGHTYAVVVWEDQGRTLELLLAPLNEYLICAFIGDDTQKRPTHRPPKAIRVQKQQPPKATSVKKQNPPKTTHVRKRRQSVIQTDPKAALLSPPDEATESTMTALQPPPEQTQADHRFLKRQPGPHPDPEAGPTSPPDKAAEGMIPAPQPPPKQTQADHHPLKNNAGLQPDPVVMLMFSNGAAERTITSLEPSPEQPQADYPLNRQPCPLPDPVAMQTSPEEAAESAIPSPEPSPEQLQVDEHPSDAMDFTQDDPDAFWQEERTIIMAQLQLGQQAHVQAQVDQQSVSQDDMDVDGDQDGRQLPDAGATGSLAESSDRFGDTHAIEFATGGDTCGSAHRVGEFETSSPDANLKQWQELCNEYLDFNQRQWL